MLIFCPSFIEASIFQEGTEATWDPRYINRPLSTSFKIYVFFLLTVCIVTIVQLLKAWRAAPPFRLSRQANNPAYLKMLEASRTRLKQWIFCTLLAWGILTSTSLYDVCNRLLGEKRIGSGEYLFVLEDYAAALTMALLVVLFAFLVRWHLVTRIEDLHTRKLSPQA
jgi:hypothetical protein